MLPELLYSAKQLQLVKLNLQVSDTAAAAADVMTHSGFGACATSGHLGPPVHV